MATDDMKELMKEIVELKIGMATINEKLDALKSVATKVDAVDHTANEALMSVKSAHERIEKIERTLYWLMTTVIGALITGAIVFFLKGGFS